MSQDFWRLPKGVDELLPPRARHLELLRRQVLDLFDVWGYDYIEPPIVEYLDALLVGNDLKLQTLQVADQVSGRTLGVRADITSQAARIDANSLADEDGRNGHTRRLCYAGPVVRANPQGVLDSRVPLKAGAEIYGCSGQEADLEIMCLAIDALHTAGVRGVVIELGHVGFVRHLVDALTLSEILRNQLFEAVRIKSEADIRAIFDKALEQSTETPAPDYRYAADRLCRLVCLMGGDIALESARKLFGATTESGTGDLLDEKLLELVSQLDYCAARLRELRPDVLVRFDLSAPVGFGYHHALVFALYDPGHGRAVARGGRYDGIGEQFGDARPATGFDLNLKTLLSLDAVTTGIDKRSNSDSVWVSFGASQESGDAKHAKHLEELDAAIERLREAGVRVVQALNEEDLRPADCGRELKHTAQGWQPV